MEGFAQSVVHLSALLDMLDIKQGHGLGRALHSQLPLRQGWVCTAGEL